LIISLQRTAFEAPLSRPGTFVEHAMRSKQS
jgi:hypothetical protein